MKTKFKMGDIHSATYNNAPVEPKNQYKRGHRFSIFDKDTKFRLAQVQVTGSDETTVTGVVINTYGHKRLGNKQKSGTLNIKDIVKEMEERESKK